LELAEPPSQVYNRKAGLAVKLGVSGSCGLGGNRNFNLKSIEFSEAGFHFNLKRKFLQQCPRVDVHLFVCPEDIWRLRTSENQAIVTMLEFLNMFQDLWDPIRPILFLCHHPGKISAASGRGEMRRTRKVGNFANLGLLWDLSQKAELWTALTSACQFCSHHERNELNLQRSVWWYPYEWYMSRWTLNNRMHNIAEFAISLAPVCDSE